MGVIMQRLTVSFLLCSALLPAQRDIPPGSLNKPERVEWFRDQGFGLFIHWSVDSQTGVVISHSLVGADEAYTKRFFEELPKTFNPRKFEPKDWAALATLEFHERHRLGPRSAALGAWLLDRLTGLRYRHAVATTRPPTPGSILRCVRKMPRASSSPWAASRPP